MKTKKTNMDYLYEFVKDNDEAKEFWEAVSEELSDKDNKIEDLEKKITNLDSQVTYLLKEYIPELEILDLGFGKIEFVYPDNLKLQGIMDELKDNPEKLLQFE